MPKKTKREKLIAQARRIIRQSQNIPLPNSTFNSFKQTPNLPTDTLRLEIPKPQEKLTVNDVAEFSAIRHDIVKTIVLAGIAVFIELLLSFKLK
jgi:hypothetical protein